MIQVVNMRHLKPGEFREVEYVGRSARGHAGSPLANPFRMGAHTPREQVLKSYRDWLAAELANPASAARLEIEELRKIYQNDGHLKLGCWCKPADCHADIIAEVIATGMTPAGGVL